MLRHNKYEKIFYRFLKREKAFIPYLRAKIKYNNMSVQKHNLCLLLNLPTNELDYLIYINFSFEWGETNEGYFYWSDLYNKWRIFIARKQSKLFVY